MLRGRIVRSGGRALADELEDRGYDEMRRELGLADPVEEVDPLLGL